MAWSITTLITCLWWQALASELPVGETETKKPKNGSSSHGTTLYSHDSWKQYGPGVSIESILNPKRRTFHVRPGTLELRPHAAERSCTSQRLPLRRLLWRKPAELSELGDRRPAA